MGKSKKKTELEKEEQIETLVKASKIQEKKGFITDRDLETIAEDIISKRTTKRGEHTLAYMFIGFASIVIVTHFILASLLHFDSFSPVYLASLGFSLLLGGILTFLIVFSEVENEKKKYQTKQY